MDKISNKIAQKRLFLLDIDGTISLDADLIDGTMDFLEEVRRINGKYIFITNNSTKSIPDYVTKFTNMGIIVDGTNFLTSSYASAIYLKKKYGKKKIYVLGTNSFVEELRAYGLMVSEEVGTGIAAAVVGFDNELTYKKVEDLCRLLLTQNVDYLATNPDLACPVGFGFIPDCGAICGMIAHAVKREPVYIGKPGALMVDLALEWYGYSKEETLVIGDRLYTDIACGIQAGVETVAVFTGEAKEADLENTEFPPTYYCDSIKEVYENLCGKEDII